MDFYQGGGGAVLPLRRHLCASCGTLRNINELVVEDSPESGLNGKLVCPDGCYDGPAPEVPILPTEEIPLEDSGWQ